MLAGEDFCGEMDLARSIEVGQPVSVLILKKHHLPTITTTTPTGTSNNHLRRKRKQVQLGRAGAGAKLFLLGRCESPSQARFVSVMLARVAGPRGRSRERKCGVCATSWPKRNTCKHVRAKGGRDSSRWTRQQQQQSTPTQLSYITYPRDGPAALFSAAKSSPRVPSGELRRRRHVSGSIVRLIVGSWRPRLTLFIGVLRARQEVGEGRGRWRGS